jgi:hypothetical protein
LLLIHHSPEEIEKTDKVILEEATLSILLHTYDLYKGIYDAIGVLSPEHFPFGFLLLFCDSAQQWGRPQLAELFQSTQEINSKKPTVKLVEIETDDEKIRVKLQYSKKPREEIQNKIIEPERYWNSTINDIDFGIGCFADNLFFTKIWKYPNPNTK